MGRKRDGRYGLAAWTAGFRQNRGLMSGDLVNQAGTGCSEGTQMFFTPFISCNLRLLKLKTEGHTISTESECTAGQKWTSFKAKIKIIDYPELVSSGFDEPPG